MLNKPSLNPVQDWALQYWIHMDRRVYIEDKHAELELQTFNLFPERWGEVYREDMLPGLGGGQKAGDIGVAFDGEAEIPVTDIDSINEWYDGISKSRGLTGEQAGRFDDPTALYLGVAEGVGRRV